MTVTISVKYTPPHKMPLITNKKALNMFEKMKNDNVPLCKIDTFFKDYIGENESINSDALVRKLRRTNK